MLPALIYVWVIRLCSILHGQNFAIMTNTIGLGCQQVSFSTITNYAGFWRLAFGEWTSE